MFYEFHVYMDDGEVVTELTNTKSSKSWLICKNNFELEMRTSDEKNYE